MVLFSENIMFVNRGTSKIEDVCKKAGEDKSEVGGLLNREIVSFRSCVRTRGLVA